MDDEVKLTDRPLFKALLRFGGFIVVYFIFFLWDRFTGHPPTPLETTIDTAMCVFGALAWLIFFAQFVLPVKTLGKRLKVVDRLITYIMGGHGPAIFVENGNIRESAGESNKKGPGVIWMDSASAAVLRTAVKFTRTIGPGVHFTEKDEYIAATVDLHPLTQNVGPDEKDAGDLDPFKIAKDNPEYENVQKRRWETSALTRDGIEVVAMIGTTFRIKAAEGEGNTRFGFNEDNVRKAITESIVQGAPTNQAIWSALPAKMAADVWREYVRKFKISQMFEIALGNDTTLQIIGNMLKKRLSQEYVEVLDDFGQFKLVDQVRQAQYRDLVESNRLDEARSLMKTALDECAALVKDKNFVEAGKIVEYAKSTEYEKLTKMGLEVNAATIKRLIFAPEIEDRLISQWTTLWLKNAQKERDLVDRKRKQMESFGQEEAQVSFALDASQEISNRPPAGADINIQRTNALEMLVHSTFLGIRRNSQLLKRITTEQSDLAKIFSWLRAKQGASNDELG
jgi:hypothetical protein